jgi:TolB-like protein
MSWRWAASALAVVAIAVIVGLAALRPVEAPQAAVALLNPSIAVLPFDEMSGDPELAYFGFGVSEDITAMLARVPNLTVVARNSAFQYRGQAVDVRRIGEELGATHILEGSVRKDTDRLRIVAQLIDARTGRHVWADRFDRTGADPRALQDEVTQKIVSALAGTAGTLALQQYAEAWGKDHANLQEYDYLLRSLSRMAIGTPESADISEAALAEGLARFPNSSLLKAQAAATVMWRFGRGWSDSENPLDDIRRAGEMAREALSDPRGSPMLRANGHISLAYANMVEGRHDQAVAEAEAALALAPYDGRMVYYLAEPLIGGGRPELALEWIERAETFYHPNDPRQQELASMKAAALLLHASGPAAALEVLSGIRTSDAIVLRTTYLVRIYALVALNRLNEARREAEKLREHDPSWSQAKHRRRFFYVDPERLELVIQALAAAGLPEN